MNWDRETEEVAQLAESLRRLESKLTDLEASHKRAQLRLQRAQEAQEVLQHLAQAVQQQVHQRISEVVTSCLAAVFEGGSYEFRIVFERKRGRTEASLRFVRDGLELDPLTATGGGMVDVAAFALRVACLILHRPRLSRVIVLDEPFKFVSAQYRQNIRVMLEKLSQDMDIQIIMVTHIEELEIGDVIEL